MIQVNRGPAPSGFNHNSQNWQQEFKVSKAQNQKLSASAFWSKVRRRKAMQSYAQKLYDAFRGKCAFCESRMKHVSSPHVEHFRPKSSADYQQLMFN